jgi:4-hydroxy-L-threonine phosphate dehydrogenase PdxA
MKLTSKSIRNKFFAITTGDSNGIGLEVAAKGLVRIHKHSPSLFNRNIFFIFVRSHEFLTDQEQACVRKSFSLLSRVFDLCHIDEAFFSSLAECKSISPHLRSTFSGGTKSKISREEPRGVVYVISCFSDPPSWVVLSAKLCINGFFSALITGPLSKPLIQKSGYGEVGHTEILKSICDKHYKTKHYPFMAFLGSEFNVAVATGHIPVKEIARKLNLELVSRLYRELKTFAKYLGDQRPIGVLGLNPHSGDQGIIGKEEILWIDQFSLKKTKTKALVPDAAFLPHQRKRYSFLLCLYHDQGLIPFKAIHGTHGAHVTLGLPLIRTSVDHGTAFDLFGQNRADSSSMELAIRSAIDSKMKI